MHDLLFANQKDWVASSAYNDFLKGCAKKIGLNVDKWETDIAGTAAKQRVDADIERVKALNIRSAPTMYMNGREVTFTEIAVSSLKDLIDAELQKTAQ